MSKSTVSETVLDVVTKHIRLNIDGLDDIDIDSSQSMKDIGASSLDVVEIASASMRELKVKVPRTKLAQLSTIQGLVDLLSEIKASQA
jgi:acyl carrier protein